MATKNEDNWLTFFSELQAYIEAHDHLPDKNVVENRGLLSKAKYLRKKIKAGTAEDWMVERFETILAMRSGENGACPPTRSGSIHPLLSRKSA